MPARVLIVDDRPQHLQYFSELLRGNGFEVLEGSDYDEALYLYHTTLPDLIILDISFPDSSRRGLDILKAIRIDAGDARTPIMMLTGVDEADLEPLSIELGAVDFVRKSVETRTLLARVRAHLRDVLSPDGISINDTLQIDLAAGEVRRRHGDRWEPTRLDRRLLDVLRPLVLNPGRVIERQRLEELFAEAEDPAGALNTCISRLRDIIETDPKQPTYIQTVRRLGYRFADYR
mgnify:CR=1 FL=1